MELIRNNRRLNYSVSMDLNMSNSNSNSNSNINSISTSTRSNNMSNSNNDSNDNNRPLSCSKRKTKRTASTSTPTTRWLWTTATVTIISIYSMSSQSSYCVDAFSVSPFLNNIVNNNVNNNNHHYQQHSTFSSSASTCTATHTSSSSIILNVSRSLNQQMSIGSSDGSNRNSNNNKRIPKLTNFYDLEEKLTQKPSYTINVEATAESTSTQMKRKIVHLLSDDDGEEDDETPDYSDAAANEIAEKSSYSRISEEAKLKANYAVQKEQTQTSIQRQLEMANGVTSAAAGASTGAGTGAGTRTKPSPAVFDEDHNVVVKKIRRFTASVKETGVDTMREYVKSMGSHELLPPESEILLGKQIQILVKWENVRQELEEELSSPPTFAQWSLALGVTVPELKKQIRRSQRAKAALIEANLRLVVTVARQTVKQGRTEINFQDACQEGIIGLNRASEKFDPEKGFRFSTYAIWWIKREVRKNLLEQSRSVRLPASAIAKINDIRINERLLITTLGRKPSDEEVAQKCNMTVEKVLFYRRKAQDATSLDKDLVGKSGKGSSASGGESNGKTIGSLVKDLGPTPSEIANKDFLQNDVRRLIRTLSPREQAVIRLRFGLDDGTPRTLDYISKKFNVAKDRIRKIEAKALLKLRQPYRNQSVKCYISDL